MQKVKDISFDIEAHANDSRVVTLFLRLKNNGSNDYYIDSKSLMKNLFNGGMFFPVKISGPSQIRCVLDTIHVQSHEMIKLKAQSSEENIVTLNEICRFFSAISGVYTAKYNATFSVFIDDIIHSAPPFYVDLVGASVFLLKDRKITETPVAQSCSNDDFEF